MVTVWLDPQEALMAEPGAMVSCQGVRMSSGKGGFLSGLERKLTGESFFLNSFSGGPSGGWVALSPPVPGSVAELWVEPYQEVLLQAGALLAYTGDLKSDADFQGLGSMFSGESAFFTRMRAAAGGGFVWCGAYGGIAEVRVNEAGGELVVDTGHLVAFEGGVDYSIGKMPGLSTLLLGGEGVVLKFAGSGSVWVQAGNLDLLERLVRKFVPTG